MCRPMTTSPDEKECHNVRKTVMWLCFKIIDRQWPTKMDAYIYSECHGLSQQIACFVKTKPANGGATIHDVHRFSAFQRAKPLSKISRSPGLKETPHHSDPQCTMICCQKVRLWRLAGKLTPSNLLLNLNRSPKVKCWRQTGSVTPAMLWLKHLPKVRLSRLSATLHLTHSGWTVHQKSSFGDCLAKWRHPYFGWIWYRK